MGLYEFVIKDKTGRTLGSLDGATERGFSLYLNKAGDARFTLSLHDPNVTDEMLLLGCAELYVYRGGVLVWGGELQYGRDNLGGEEEATALSAKGFLDLFKGRHAGTAASPRVFTGTDLATIARTLVAETQALPDGDFGITLGLNPASRPADRAYSYENLREALNDLTNETWDDALDIEVTPDKVFNCYYPRKGRVLSEQVFEWGVNVTSAWRILDATELSNEVTALGAGEGNAMLTATATADAAIRGTYRLRQATISHKSVSELATLQGHADREVAAKGAQQQFVGITVKGNQFPTFGSYAVGDWVPVKIRRGRVNVDGLQRIHGIDVAITDNDEETITLVFSNT